MKKHKHTYNAEFTKLKPTHHDGFESLRIDPPKGSVTFRCICGKLKKSL